MSINVRQLHVGAHVLVNGKRERVRGIDEDNGLIVRFPAEYVSACDVEPIAITPELLTELGFENWSELFVGKDKRYGKRINDKEVVFSPISDDCWKVGLLYGGFDAGYCLCCCLHQAEAFLALYNVELLAD